MLRQIRYFQSVVKNNSFSEAADECHISQSAISQQVQALEAELGFKLLERKNRKFFLTPAGEFFYQKSLILVADYEQMVRDAKKIARDDKAVLRIGCLRTYAGGQIQRALAEFAARYPDVSVVIEQGNHEELYEMLKSEQADIVLNDQRRAFSDVYNNEILTTSTSCIEVSSHNPIAQLSEISPQDLKNTTCILVASKEQREIEREYYHDIVGFKGDFVYADNLEAARLLVLGSNGFMPVEGSDETVQVGTSLIRIPLVRNGEPVRRNYCAFWKKTNSGYYVEEFFDILKAQYEKQN